MPITVGDSDSLSGPPPHHLRVGRRRKKTLKGGQILRRGKVRAKSNVLEVWTSDRRFDRLILRLPLHLPLGIIAVCPLPNLVCSRSRRDVSHTSEGLSSSSTTNKIVYRSRRQCHRMAYRDPGGDCLSHTARERAKKRVPSHAMLSFSFFLFFRLFFSFFQGQEATSARRTVRDGIV